MSFGIELKVGKDAPSSSIKATGETFHVITDEERATFGIEDAPLKRAVAAYFGKSPNDAYVRSPTPWNDLYKTYSWEQVTLHLRAVDAQITGITSTPVIVKTQVFRNNSSKSATFDCSISEDVSDTIEANWSTTLGLSVTQSVYYGAMFVGGSTDVSFSADFQRGGSEARTVTVGQTSGVMVDLDPGESVKANLRADRGELRARVVYDAYLSGVCAVNYNPRYQDHHFWALAMSGVLPAGGLPAVRKIVVDIKVGFFSNGEIVLEDLAGKRRVAVPADMEINTLFRRPWGPRGLSTEEGDMDSSDAIHTSVPVAVPDGDDLFVGAARAAAPAEDVDEPQAKVSPARDAKRKAKFRDEPQAKVAPARDAKGKAKFVD